MGTGGPSPEVKGPKHEADHTPSSSAEVKNVWSYTSSSHTLSWRGALLSTGYVFMAWYLVKHMGNFTLPYEATSMSNLNKLLYPRIWKFINNVFFFFFWSQSLTNKWPVSASQLISLIVFNAVVFPNWIFYISNITYTQNHLSWNHFGF